MISHASVIDRAAARRNREHPAGAQPLDIEEEIALAITLASTLAMLPQWSAPRSHGPPRREYPYHGTMGAVALPPPILYHGFDQHYHMRPTQVIPSAMGVGIALGIPFVPNPYDGSVPPSRNLPPRSDAQRSQETLSWQRHDPYSWNGPQWSTPPAIFSLHLTTQRSEVEVAPPSPFGVAIGQLSQKIPNALNTIAEISNETGIRIWVTDKKMTGRGLKIVYVESEEDRQTLIDNWNDRFLCRDKDLMVATSAAGKNQLSAILATPPNDTQNNPKSCVTFARAKKQLAPTSFALNTVSS